jgi:predicted small lipoprotein YifL
MWQRPSSVIANLSKKGLAMRNTSEISRMARRLPLALLTVSLMVAAAMNGCGKRGPELAPVSGKVTYKGQPLKFGGVTFQPEVGWAATGVIQPDGTFRMVMTGRGDGAVVGKNKIRIACFTNQDPSKKGPGGTSLAGGIALGAPLIPRKYLSYETSGLEVEVRSGTNDPVVLELD